MRRRQKWGIGGLGVTAAYCLKLRKRGSHAWRTDELDGTQRGGGVWPYLKDAKVMVESFKCGTTPSQKGPGLEANPQGPDDSR